MHRERPGSSRNAGLRLAGVLFLLAVGCAAPEVTLSGVTLAGPGGEPAESVEASVSLDTSSPPGRRPS